jgi:hypothetical protein
VLETVKAEIVKDLRDKQRSPTSIKTGENEPDEEDVPLNLDISPLKTMVILCDAPASLVRQISPSTAKVQRYARLPLLLMCLMCGMNSGLGMCMSKICLETWRSSGWRTVTTITMLIAMWSAST